MEKALADVKLIPAKQYKMQKKDMNRIKEVLEEEIKKEIKTIEEKWALKERMRETASGMMNLQNSQFSPLSGASPPFPAYLYPISKKSLQDDETKKNKKVEQNEKSADQLAKQLYVVNSAIDQLKQSIDQSKRTLTKPLTKMVTTIVHSQNNDLMNQPKFKETENWNNLSKLSQNETGIIDSDHYLKNDNLTSLKELTIDSRYKYKQKLDENLDNEQSLTEKNTEIKIDNLNELIQENQLNPKEISENPNEIDKNLNEENALNQNEKLKKAKGELIKIQMKAENEVIKSEKTKKQEDLDKMVAHSNIIQNKLKPLNKYMNDEDEKMISPSSNSLKSLSKNGAIPNSHIFINQIN